MKTGKSLSIFTLPFLSIAVIFLACGGGGGSSSSYNDNDNGSYACSMAIDCVDVGVETFVFNFFDESYGYLAYGVFDCKDHSYTVDGIPAGTNRRLMVTGEGSNGTVLYQAELSGITIVANQTTQGGEIQMVRVWTILKLPDTGQITSYTATFGEDSDYSINPPSYTDNGNGTVTDNVTGLMWQQEDDETTRIWDDAVSYCNNLTLAGYTDWRLPSKKELMSIVDYEIFSPSIDMTYFPGTNASNYWSSTTYMIDFSFAWYVYFIDGSVYGYNKSSYYYVRCVRGGQ